MSITKQIKTHHFRVTSAGAVAMPIAGEVVYYTDAVNVERATDFCLIYKAASSGVADLKIEIQQCWRLPTTEYAIDADYVEGESISDVEANLTTTSRKHKSVTASINPVKYVRLKITGNAGNDASTTLEATLQMQEEN